MPGGHLGAILSWCPCKRPVIRAILIYESYRFTAIHFHLLLQPQDSHILTYRGRCAINRSLF